MALVFVDTAGETGVIRDDLSVSYDGPNGTRESIQEFIDEITTDPPPSDAILETLLIELPHQVPIRESNESTIHCNPIVDQVARSASTTTAPNFRR